MDNFTKLFICRKNEKKSQAKLMPQACFWDYLEEDEKVQLYCSYLMDEENNQLYLKVKSDDKEELDDEFHHYSPLRHAEHCPFQIAKKQNKQIPFDPKLEFRVAVSILLERFNPNTNKKEVLITRRSKKMRTFPSVWVAPGGFNFFLIFFLIFVLNFLLF